MIERAFAQAARKRGRPVRSMTLAVLKNRLLQLTDRQFNPSEYGSRTLLDLLESLAPSVAVIKTSSETMVELRTGQLGRRTYSSDESTAYEPIALDSAHIREDLWIAIVDYASGRRYVWDESHGRARVARAEDALTILPTLTQQEHDAWRHDFVEANLSTLNASDGALAMRWRELRLPTAYLPLSLQPLWNRELTRRVRHRLHRFFGTATGSSESAPGVEPDSTVKVLSDLKEQYQAARDRGDSFAAGELLARSLVAGSEEPVASVLARIVSLWSSTKGLTPEPDSMANLVAGLDSLSEENAATALVNAAYRLRKDGVDLPEEASDLAYRLREKLSVIYGVDGRKSPLDKVSSAAGRLESAISEIEGAVDRFLRTTAATAKPASIEILRLSHSLHPMLLPAERGLLRDLEVLIGPAFRKLCEAYERHEDVQVLRRAPEFLQNVKSHTPDAKDPRKLSAVWLRLVAPILEHLSGLVEEAMSRGEAALAPILGLRNHATKADLRLVDREVYLSFALRNTGRGIAYDVSLESLSTDPSVKLAVVEPAGPFDISAEAEQLVRVRLLLSEVANQLSLPIRWLCQTTLGKQATFDDSIEVTQQVTEPNWEALISDPPYSLNPIKRPDRLYGRDSTLRRLHLAAMSGASTFVWGQKRIGKTSLLQVLAAKLGERDDTTCILLRMGEIGSLHEGEIARTIASRVVERSGVDIAIPSEAHFGAGISRLISFVEALCSIAQNRKFVVIIDEFDDLDPSFYTGERGKQFVKALRSISEVGLTFFFIGSERMEAIYRRHQADLNKWTNIQLDRIDSRTECKALITTPVANAIEFSHEAVDFIIDYCGGNPFYIHNFCYQVFDRCLQEHRTFVDDNDTNAVRHQLLRALGPTNFSHFWEDNPLLDSQERAKAIAENCITLTCISILGGRYESVEELIEVQASLPLSAADRAGVPELRRSTERLLARRVLTPTTESDGFVVSLQIFREWLAENGVSKLLPVWTEYRESQLRADVPEENGSAAVKASPDPSIFVIPDDEIIAVSQQLVYCGKQKDVADIRAWLRQFDDDARIEVAFLLLKRLAERGFIKEGAKSLALAKLEEMITARRQELGQKKWKVVRGRLDNLCLVYVDSELKSGADTARDLRNMIRPGKSGAATEIGGWMRSHIDDDPIVVVVDDFAGSGKTLAKGLKRLKENVDAATWSRYVEEHRVSVFVMYAFPEAIEHARQACPGLHIVAAQVLGDDLRACSEDSGIFDNDGERRFTRDVLVQLGRELYPDAPLGFGDLGALVAFHNAIPNNTLPIFWSAGRVSGRPWKPLLPRA